MARVRTAAIRRRHSCSDARDSHRAPRRAEAHALVVTRPENGATCIDPHHTRRPFMTAAILAAAGAANAAAAKQLADTLERFRVADATAPERAQSLESLGLRPDGAVKRLAAAGVILPGARGGRFYLSEVALAAFQRQQGKQRLWAAVAGAMCILLGLAALLLTMRMGAPAPR